MDKLMEHTLQKQMNEMNEMKAQLAKLTMLLGGLTSSAIIPASSQLHAEGGSTIVNGGVTQNVTQSVTQNIKVEIRPWDNSRAITVGVADIARAFAENAKLQEFARLPGDSLADPEIAPPYVTELLVDLVKRGHADPAARNIYLNPRRADQVLVHMKGGSWEVKTMSDGIGALLSGIAVSIHEVTLSTEKRRQLPLEAQNALAMAGLLYDDEPDAYVGRARAPLVAHLTNLAPKELKSP